jgi:hypothetical protein
MNSYYIYKAELINKEPKTITVIYNPNNHFNFDSLGKELKEFHEYNSQTDGILFLFGIDTTDAIDSIKNNYTKIFKNIPVVEEESLKQKAFFVRYDAKKVFEIIQDENTVKYNFGKDDLGLIIHQGLQNIFISRGGLVEANGDMHHYVFPSGKHSSKFLRVANILLYKSEIYFIATSLLGKIKEKDFDNIYCDTSSINSIAIAIADLCNRFNDTKSINICSFKSYDGLYDKNTEFEPNSIFLISASTSGGIINYMITNHEDIKNDEIYILFFLHIKSDNPMILEHVLCDLTFDSHKNKFGIEKYDVDTDKDCKYCKKGSYPVTISGDIFLLEEPKVNVLLINTSYITSSLKSFVSDFKSKNEKSILKVNYKESSSTSERKYDIFIDYENIINNLERFPRHKTKLDAYINQYVPNNIKYIIHLNDKGSYDLALYIKNKISENLKNSESIIICNQNELNNKISDDEGAVLIVGSCISNGKNLLYLSRYLRNFEKLRIIYFVGINRVSNENNYNELKSNLKYGTYGKENSTFIEIEKINCDNISIENSWQREWNFNNDIIDTSDDKQVKTFFKERNKILNEFNDSRQKGGANEIFLPILNPTGTINELKIRKNSAFFDGNDYFEKVSQSDIYFTISNVLNNMRNSTKENLKQSTFVRNLISPSNFNRFNDGIIQSSLLRASRAVELNYNLDESLSKEMKDILTTIIKYNDQEQGEAILEFLYSLAINKLRLRKEHYDVIISLLEEEDNLVYNVYKDAIIKHLKEKNP